MGTLGAAGLGLCPRCAGGGAAGAHCGELRAAAPPSPLGLAASPWSVSVSACSRPHPVPAAPVLHAPSPWGQLCVGTPRPGGAARKQPRAEGEAQAAASAREGGRRGWGQLARADPVGSLHQVRGVGCGGAGAAVRTLGKKVLSKWPVTTKTCWTALQPGEMRSNPPPRPSVKTGEVALEATAARAGVGPTPESARSRGH